MPAYTRCHVCGSLDYTNDRCYSDDCRSCTICGNPTDWELHHLTDMAVCSERHAEEAGAEADAEAQFDRMIDRQIGAF